MGIQIGGIDLTNEIINTKLRLRVLEKIVQALVEQAGPLTITQQHIDNFREQALKELQTEHPDAGIKKEQQEQAINVDVETLVEKIYVSPSAPSWFTNLVETVIKKFGFNFEISQSDINKDPMF